MKAQNNVPAHLYRVRWAVDVAAWQPCTREFSSALSCLPPAEQASCERFLRTEDRKRALVSRLLQRRFGCQALGVQRLDQMPIARTERGKPFFRPLPHLTGAPNLNFNVSHEGDWVVLVSEPCLACGVDVAAPDQLSFMPELPMLERMRNLLDCFSEEEMTAAEAVRDAPQHRHCKLCAPPSADAAVEHHMRHLWSAKESVLKARGDGLTFPPCQASFELPQKLLKRCVHTEEHRDSGDQVVEVVLHLRGKRAEEWRVRLSMLPGDHIVAVATAPPAAIVDQDILATFHELDIAVPRDDTISSQPFTYLTIRDLIGPTFDGNDRG